MLLCSDLPPESDYETHLNWGDVGGSIRLVCEQSKKKKNKCQGSLDSRTWGNTFVENCVLCVLYSFIVEILLSHFTVRKGHTVNANLTESKYKSYSWLCERKKGSKKGTIGFNMSSQDKKYKNMYAVLKPVL